MNILITGAGGQLGRTFRDVAAGGEHKCFFTDICEGEGITSLDVTDFEAVMSFLEASDADVIVNCAAYTNVDGAESDEGAARIVNVEAPKVLVQCFFFIFLFIRNHPNYISVVSIKAFSFLLILPRFVPIVNSSGFPKEDNCSNPNQ